MSEPSQIPEVDWITVVLGNADRLRAAGVLSLGMGEFSVTFAAAAPAIPKSEIEKPDADEDDALENPFHGLRGFEPEPR